MLLRQKEGGCNSANEASSWIDSKRANRDLRLKDLRFDDDYVASGNDKVMGRKPESAAIQAHRPNINIERGTSRLHRTSETDQDME